jgi:glutamine synthetase
MTDKLPSNKWLKEKGIPNHLYDAFRKLLKKGTMKQKVLDEMFIDSWIEIRKEWQELNEEKKE